MKVAVLVFLLVSLTGSVALADTITLSNGDKITGTIDELNPKSVIVITPYAGKITIDRLSVKTLESKKAVPVVTPQGERSEMYLTPLAAGTGWRQTPIALPPPPAPPPGPPRHSSYLYFGPDWKNQATLGAVNTTGNDNTTAVNAGLNFHYLHKPSELTINFQGLYGTSNGQQTQSLADQNAVYRRELTNRWYLYADDDVRYDGIKGISLQASVSAGPGYYFFRGEKFNVDLRGGPGVTYQKYFDSQENTSVSAEVGLRISYIINDHLNATDETIYTTAVTDPANWRLHSETALNYKLDLESGLGLKLAFNDDYDNQPSTGFKNNDTRLTVALTLDF